MGVKPRDAIINVTDLDPAELILAVPDLHGCWRAARSAVSFLLELDSDVVFLGDYVDRGESSPQTIEELIASGMPPNWTFLLGNHEMMLLEDLQGCGYSSCAMPDQALSQYQRFGGIPRRHLEFLSNLKPYHETENLIFVHGGIAQASPEVPLEQRSVEELCWTYDIDPAWRGKKIVRGHRLTPYPFESRNHIDLESGVWLPDGRLTIGVLRAYPMLGEPTLLGWIEISGDGKYIRAVIP